jgi:hypothetical protein
MAGRSIKITDQMMAGALRMQMMKETIIANSYFYMIVSFIICILRAPAII